MKKIITVAVAGLIALAGCAPEADVASENISTAADQFEVLRRIVFFNGITDEYLLELEGFCSIKSDNIDRQLEVTCKDGPSSFRKHFLGLSDNVTYFVEHLDATDVSTSRYRVVFRPSTIIPEVQN